MSETISSGGFSSASEYRRNWSKGGVEVRAPSLVLPSEAVALPDVGPAIAAAVFPRTALKAGNLAQRVPLGRRRLAEQKPDGLPNGRQSRDTERARSTHQ